MKNLFRLLCLSFLVLGQTAYADTVPAVSASKVLGWHAYNSYGNYGGGSSNAIFNQNSAAEACSVIPMSGGYSNPAFDGSGGCNGTYNGTVYNVGTVRSAMVCPSTRTELGTCPLSCPSGYTMDAGGATCSAPDCTPPNVRQPDGSCNDPCTARAGNLPVNGWYSSNVGSPSLDGSNYCDSGCSVALNPAPTGTAYTNGKIRWQSYSKVELGYACTGGMPSVPAAGVDPVKPVEPEKKPPCAVGEGVLTSSSGTIACVPAGVPGSTPPVVKKDKNVEAFPDGSAKTTETITTRDPSTGVEDKQQIITVTPGSNGSPGSAGTPGVSSSAGTSQTTTGGDPNKPGDSDFCAKNPGLQMCKGGMNEEATQKKVQQAIETAFDTDGLTNDAITNAQADAAKKQDADDAGDATKNKLSGGTDANADQASFRSDLATWFDPVPAGSCSALSAQIGPWTWTWDPCPTAQKVSVIAEYAMWVFLCFSTFALVTRKAE